MKKEFFPIVLILILAFSRIIPHPPNFTPIISMAVMSGFLLKNSYTSIVVVLLSMLISDIIIGFHSGMIIVYLSLTLIIFTFNKFSKKLSILNVALLSLSGSLLFFIITNFGVWITSELYDKNISGLLKCYVLAIPFFHNTLVSTLFFSYIAMLANMSFKKISV